MLTIHPGILDMVTCSEYFFDYIPRRIQFVKESMSRDANKILPFSTALCAFMMILITVKLPGMV